MDIHCTYYIKCNVCNNFSKAYSIKHNIENFENWKCFGCNEIGSLEVYYIKYNTYKCKNCDKIIDGHRNLMHGALCDDCEINLNE